MYEYIFKHENLYKFIINMGVSLVIVIRLKS